MKKKAFLMCFLAIVSVMADTQDKEKKQEAAAVPPGEIATTKHSVKIDGALIHITAHAGTVQLRNEENKPIALFGFGWALNLGVVTVMLLDRFPARRGMASSLQAGIASAANGLVAGAIVPAGVDIMGKILSLRSAASNTAT